MTSKKLKSVILLAAVTIGGSVAAQDSDMSFFLTSNGPGDGGNLGGLSGADAHCQSLATAAGAGGKTWRAYLSTTGDDSVDARDRIGTGPWHDANGVQVANDVDDLHSDNNKLGKEHSISEMGEQISVHPSR